MEIKLTEINSVGIPAGLAARDDGLGSRPRQFGEERYPATCPRQGRTETAADAVACQPDDLRDRNFRTVAEHRISAASA